jgi:hypothetical protein
MYYDSCITKHYLFVFALWLVVFKMVKECGSFFHGVKNCTNSLHTLSTDI